MAKEIKNTRHSSPTPFKMLSHKGIWGWWVGDELSGTHHLYYKLIINRLEAKDDEWRVFCKKVSKRPKGAEHSQPKARHGYRLYERLLPICAIFYIIAISFLPMKYKKPDNASEGFSGIFRAGVSEHSAGSVGGAFFNGLANVLIMSTMHSTQVIKSLVIMSLSPLPSAEKK